MKYNLDSFCLDISSSYLLLFEYIGKQPERNSFTKLKILLYFCTLSYTYFLFYFSIDVHKYSNYVLSYIGIEFFKSI